jgi:hypothetical protein
MSPDQLIKRVLRLHEKADRHQSEYERLMGAGSRKARALRHLHRAEQLRSQISESIRELGSIQS